MVLFLKLLVLNAFSLIVFGFYNHNEMNEGANGAKIKFEKESYDFGELEDGDIVDHVFKFSNVGDEVLIIHRTKGS